MPKGKLKSRCGYWKLEFIAQCLDRSHTIKDTFRRGLVVVHGALGGAGRQNTGIEWCGCQYRHLALFAQREEFVASRVVEQSEACRNHCAIDSDAFHKGACDIKVFGCRTKCSDHAGIS